MKDLQKLFNECKKELDDIGIKYGNIVKLEVNYRFKKTWGQCSYVNKNENKFKIEIAAKLLQDDIDDISTKNTIIHELLHSCKDCMNHGNEWKRLANIVNKKYPQYNIKRTTSNKSKGIEYEDKDFNYILECKKCGNKLYFSKMCKRIIYAENGYLIHLNCGGKFKRIK